MSGRRDALSRMCARLRVWSTGSLVPEAVASLLRSINEQASYLINENNALRRRNARLTRENEELRKRASGAGAAARAAQTMATHWRIEARGGDYDATKEDAP